MFSQYGSEYPATMYGLLIKIWIKNEMEEVPWRSSSQDFALPLQGAWVQSLRPKKKGKLVLPDTQI